MITKTPGVYHAVAHRNFQSLYYEGMLSDEQISGKTYRGKRYMSYERDPFNDYQNFLYHRALFGLKVYTPEELTVMHWEKKKRIFKVHQKVQTTLNLLKQQRVINFTNDLLSIFKKSNLIKEIISNFSVPIQELDNTMSFKELNISKSDIIEKLIEIKVLPSNFLNLKANPELKRTVK